MALSFAGYRALGNINPATGAFTEITGGGYARQAVTLTPDGSGKLTPTADVTYGPATGSAWPAFTAAAIYDAVSAGNLVLWYDTLVSNTIAVGASHTALAARTGLIFPVGGYTVHGTPVHLGKDVNVSGKTVLVAGV